MKRPIHGLNAPRPMGPYCQAVQAGQFLFVSGQLAIDPKQDKIVISDITMQTRQVMENLKASLKLQVIVSRMWYNQQCTLLIWLCLRNSTVNTLNTLNQFFLLESLLPLNLKLER